MGDLVAGRTALVVGVANKRSLAWGIAQRLDAEGARVVLTYQNERTERDVRRLGETLTGIAGFLPMDVQDDAQVTSAVAGAAEMLGGGIDVLVHAVAFARAEDLGGRYVDTPRDGFQLAVDVSAYSLTALARTAEPFMRGRDAAIVTLSYIAAERAVPGYNVMGIAKSTLESIVRYLAWDLGPEGIRVNAVSAGPVRTLAARSIPGFGDMAGAAAARSPLRREVDADEVADGALFLCSPLARGVTGHVLYVDAGFHAMGL
ncbi:MAG: enoyl-ACP reductase [Thermoleophilia bacterium]|jgi:enoyl-[acyl-carrier protein] reductase I|nr:enoyl-ACP reductase [Thermoleophilia bacterium]